MTTSETHAMQEEEISASSRDTRSNTLSRMSRALTAVLMGFFFHGSIIISLMIILTIFFCHIRKVLMGVMPQIINCEQSGMLQLPMN